MTFHYLRSNELRSNKWVCFRLKINFYGHNNVDSTLRARAFMSVLNLYLSTFLTPQVFAMNSKFNEKVWVREPNVLQVRYLSSLKVLLTWKFNDRRRWKQKRFTRITFNCSYLTLALNEWQNFAAVFMNNWTLWFQWLFELRRAISGSVIMTTNLAHPYKDHPEPWKIPAERKDEIEELYQWFVNDKSFQLRWDVRFVLF